MFSLYKKIKIQNLQPSVYIKREAKQAQPFLETLGQEVKMSVCLCACVVCDIIQMT